MYPQPPQGHQQHHQHHQYEPHVPPLHAVTQQQAEPPVQTLPPDAATLRMAHPTVRPRGVLIPLAVSPRRHSLDSADSVMDDRRRSSGRGTSTCCVPAVIPWMVLTLLAGIVIGLVLRPILLPTDDGAATTASGGSASPSFDGCDCDSPATALPDDIPWCSPTPSPSHSPSASPDIHLMGHTGGGGTGAAAPVDDPFAPPLFASPEPTPTCRPLPSGTVPPSPTPTPSTSPVPSSATSGAALADIERTLTQSHDLLSTVDVTTRTTDAVLAQMKSGVEAIQLQTANIQRTVMTLSGGGPPEDYTLTAVGLPASDDDTECRTYMECGEAYSIQRGLGRCHHESSSKMACIGCTSTFTAKCIRTGL